MHEMTIANAILAETLRAVASQEDTEALVVEQVDVAIGELQAVVAEALELAWGAVIEGTCAEGASLVTQEVAPRAQCRACDERFAPSVREFVCPACGVADAEILAGNDIVLTSVTCRTREG